MAPVRAARKATPSCRSATTGPDRRSPSGNRMRTSPASSTCWARRSASRSADSRCTGKAPTAGRMRPNQLVLPQAVLGHVVEFALGDLGGHEEVDEGAVHRGDDHRAGGRHPVGALDRGPEQQPVEQVDQQAEEAVDGREPGVHHGLDDRAPVLAVGRAPVVGRRRHSHATTSSTMSSTSRSVVSTTRAPSATPSGETARVLSSRSRRATASAPSSGRRRARSSAVAVR